MASVLGAILTVHYSRKAKNSADAAEVAAIDARGRMLAIDWVLNFSEIVSHIDDLIAKISHDMDRSYARKLVTR